MCFSQTLFIKHHLSLEFYNLLRSRHPRAGGGMQLTVFTAANKHTRRTGRSRGRGVKMSESVSVFGGRVPAEVELLWKHLKNLKRDTFTQILRAVVDAVDGQDCCEAVREISESGFVSEESLNHVMAGLYALLKEALCLPALRQEVFNEDLRALRIPEEFLADVSSVVFGNRQTSMNVSDRHQGPSLAKLEEFKWRVDVAISTSSQARALQPSILMQMKLSDGHLYRFEVPVVKFQELRYNVSLILKEMNDTEKRSILKIQD